MFRIKNSLLTFLILLSISSLLIIGCGEGEVEEPMSSSVDKSDYDKLKDDAKQEVKQEVKQQVEEKEDEDRREAMSSGLSYPEKPPVIGMILVGPRNDKGWSQAHFEGGQYAAEALNGELITVDLVNPADNPDLTIPGIAEDMIDQGANVIFATSDDMKDGILEAAAMFPDTDFVWSSGDSALEGGKGYKPELENLANIMGQMEYGQMIAGCAAALKSKNGKIGFLGPLINDETRRLANATYLGAIHCSNQPIDFKTIWIGFWFHIPGVTLDPTQVTNEFFDEGRDVVISHIDTTEALVVGGQRAESGEDVWVVPYDYEGACEQAPEICLGVNYFNWGPDYLEIVEKSLNGEFINEWIWSEPDWDNMDESTIGWHHGPGLFEDEASKLDQFIDELASGMNLFMGPLNFEDGSTYLKADEVANEMQVWYTPQLLSGMNGEGTEAIGNPMDDASPLELTQMLLGAYADNGGAYDPPTVGVILVGPRNDKGWSQAHFEGAEYAAKAMNGDLITVDFVNPADNPDLTIPGIAEDMIDQGADLIIATSDDMKDGILEAAAMFPNTTFVWASGDSALESGKGYKPELTNLGNVMGQMEYGQMIAGCAAALKSKDGKIGFLGPLINDETRRLANATYLGAKYCAGDKALDFKVTWIGFWFHIPGVTLDPTQVTNEFFDEGRDVVISHIDTTEALVVGGQRAAGGEDVWVVPYDYEGACEQAPEICLGVNYFNWGPAYLMFLNGALNMDSDPNTWDQLLLDGDIGWGWVGPYWKDITHPDKSFIGWHSGDGLNGDESQSLDSFIGELANGLNLYTGPLNFQDGTVYVESGKSLDWSGDHLNETSGVDAAKVWYTPQLLEGIEGSSE